MYNKDRDQEVLMLHRVLSIIFLSMGFFILPAFSEIRSKKLDKRRTQNQTQNIQHVKYRTVSYPVYRNYPRTYPFYESYYIYPENYYPSSL